MTSRPAGNSAEAGIRRLRRYAGSAALCAEKGIDQAVVADALRRCESGEIAVAAALKAAGLRPGPDAQIDKLAGDLNPTQLGTVVDKLQYRQQVQRFEEQGLTAISVLVVTGKAAPADAFEQWKVDWEAGRWSIPVLVDNHQGQDALEQRILEYLQTRKADLTAYSSARFRPAFDPARVVWNWQRLQRHLIEFPDDPGWDVFCRFAELVSPADPAAALASHRVLATFTHGCAYLGTLEASYAMQVLAAEPDAPGWLTTMARTGRALEAWERLNATGWLLSLPANHGESHIWMPAAAMPDHFPDPTDICPMQVAA